MTAANVIRLHPIVPPPHPVRAPSMFATTPTRASLALTGALAFLIGMNVVGVWLEHRAMAREVARLIERDGIQPISPEEFNASFDFRTE